IAQGCFGRSGAAETDHRAEAGLGGRGGAALAGAVVAGPLGAELLGAAVGGIAEDVEVDAVLALPAPVARLLKRGGGVAAQRRVAVGAVGRPAHADPRRARRWAGRRRGLRAAVARERDDLAEAGLALGGRAIELR